MGKLAKTAADSDPRLKRVMRSLCPDSVAVLAEIQMDPSARAADRIMAATKLLEWTLGRPAQTLEQKIDVTRPIVFSTLLAPEATQAIEDQTEETEDEE